VHVLHHLVATADLLQRASQRRRVDALELIAGFRAQAEHGLLLEGAHDLQKVEHGVCPILMAQLASAKLIAGSDKIRHTSDHPGA